MLDTTLLDAEAWRSGVTMSRGTWTRTARAARALVAVAMVATLLPTGPPAMAAEPSPSPSATSTTGAGMCPADHIVPTVGVSPDATLAPGATPAQGAALNGPPPSDGAPDPSVLRSPPTDIPLGGTWSALPRSPFASTNPTVVWAGDRMVAFDPRRGRTATYDPLTRRWEEHQRMPGSDSANGETINGPSPPVWTGSEVVVLGYRDRPDSIKSLGFAFVPARGRWRAIAPPPIDDAREAVWTGSLLLVAAPDRQVAAYDPAADCWLRLPEMPLPQLPENARTWRAMEWELDSIHWTGDGLLAVVTTESSRVPIGVVSFDPGTWSWEPGPQAPPSSQLSRPVYAEGRLWFLFGDPAEDTISNATYDPRTRQWQALETNCAITSSWADLTGRLIMQPRWERRAWDPSTGQCYRIPRVKDRARTGGAEVWTGRDYLIWSGAYGDSGRAFPDGIVYRPPRKAVTADTRPFSDKLRRAISSRRKNGFDTDPDVVRPIMRDPYQPKSRQHGFPMTEAESRDLLTRSSFAGRASDIQRWLRTLPTFGGLWQDQRVGGDIVIALTEADHEVLRGIDQRFTPYDTPTPWRLVIVPRTERELKRALWRVGAVSKRLDPAAMLWAAGVDLSGGRLSLTYDPDDVARMRARKQELERALGVPVRITSGRVRDT